MRPHGGKVKINAKTVGMLHKIYKERKRELEQERRKRLELAEAAF